MKILWTVVVLVAVVLSGCQRWPSAESVMRSFADISVQRALDDWTYGSEHDPEQPLTWAGSGTVVKAVVVDGEDIIWILTAKHVVEAGTDHHVRLYDGESWTEQYPAEVFATHPNRDLALLRVRGVQPFGVASLSVREPKRWDSVWTVGQTLMGVPLPNHGVVTGRIVRQPEGWSCEWSEVDGDLMINAHIRPGYSGGPTFIMDRGEWRLAGVNVMITVYGWGQLAPEQAWIEPVFEVWPWLLQLGWEIPGSALRPEASPSADPDSSESAPSRETSDV